MSCRCASAKSWYSERIGVMHLRRRHHQGALQGRERQSLVAGDVEQRGLEHGLVVGRRSRRIVDRTARHAEQPAERINFPFNAPCAIG